MALQLEACPRSWPSSLCASLRQSLTPRAWLLGALGPEKGTFATVPSFICDSPESLLILLPPDQGSTSSLLQLLLLPSPIPREGTWLFCRASSTPPAKNRGKKMALHRWNGAQSQKSCCIFLDRDLKKREVREDLTYHLAQSSNFPHWEK